jgi:hypothetical protein
MDYNKKIKEDLQDIIKIIKIKTNKDKIKIILFYYNND